MLLMQAGTCCCALPVANVGEVLRPLAMQPLVDVPEFVTGVAVIRGRATPVLSLQSLLSGQRTTDESQRWVVLRLDGEQAALAVESVAGVRGVTPDQLQSVSRLLEEVRPQAVARVGALDQRLLLVLEAGRIVPEGVWAALAARVTRQ